MRKIFYIFTVVIVAIVIDLLLQPKNETNLAYHVTLADPKIYKNGTFTDNFKIQKGTYLFSFVPNGDSPQKLSILLTGNSFSYIGDFSLNGTIHNSGISTYYTWDYSGRKMIEVPEEQQIQVTINPHGNLLGSVSVSLIKE